MQTAVKLKMFNSLLKTCLGDVDSTQVKYEAAICGAVKEIYRYISVLQSLLVWV